MKHTLFCRLAYSRLCSEHVNSARGYSVKGLSSTERRLRQLWRQKVKRYVDSDCTTVLPCGGWKKGSVGNIKNLMKWYARFTIMVRSEMEKGYEFLLHPQITYNFFSHFRPKRWNFHIQEKNFNKKSDKTNFKQEVIPVINKRTKQSVAWWAWSVRVRLVYNEF